MFTLHARVSVCSSVNTIVGLEILVYAMGLKADRHYMKPICGISSTYTHWANLSPFSISEYRLSTYNKKFSGKPTLLFVNILRDAISLMLKYMYVSKP
jgi:hypothetical protein